MTTPLPIRAILAMLCALACLPADAAAPPKPYNATVIRWPDADTVIVKHCLGTRCREEKIRLRGFDAPELAHNRNEVDQPGGREALAFVNANYGKGVVLKISRVGKPDFYGRIVANVSGEDGKDVACALAREGHGMPDQRFQPSEELKAAAKEAAESKRGIWAQGDSLVPPWQWRKENRARIIQLRKAG